MPAKTRAARKDPSDRMKHYIERSREGAARVAEDPEFWELLDSPPKTTEAMTLEEFRKKFRVGD